MAKQRELIGTVISDKMQKTIVVKTMHKAKHAKYNRILKQYNKFKVHDEKGSAKIGDVVRIVTTRPLSKEKTFRLVEIIQKAQAGSTHVEPQEEIK